MPGFRGANSGSTRERGYGYDHQKRRATAFALLPEISPCCRCGKPMRKSAKDKHGRSTLHYDHNTTRTGYRGFAHARCNVKAGAAEGARRANRNSQPRPWHSRKW